MELERTFRTKAVLADGHSIYLTRNGAIKLNPMDQLAAAEREQRALIYRETIAFSILGRKFAPKWSFVNLEAVIPVKEFVNEQGEDPLDPSAELETGPPN